MSSASAAILMSRAAASWLLHPTLASDGMSSGSVNQVTTAGGIDGPDGVGAAVTLLTLCDTMESGSPECRIVSRVSEPTDSAAEVSPQPLILPPATAGD